MKLNNETLNVTRSGPFKETGFRIAANANAFDILSSKLYTNTRLAIVRELSTNAYDAHVAAGNKERPFKVHLPNRLESFFSIPGLGREILVAVNRSDFPVIKAATVYLAMLTMLINLSVDVLYKAVDPRVSFK